MLLRLSGCNELLRAVLFNRTRKSFATTFYTACYSSCQALVERMRITRLDHTISLSATSLPYLSQSLSHLSSRNVIKLNGDLKFTAVAEPIVKGEDTLRLVRHASIAALCRGNAVGLVRRIAQIEIGRPHIAIYHAHTSAMLSSSSFRSNSIKTYRRLCAPPHRCRRCPRA